MKHLQSIGLFWRRFSRNKAAAVGAVVLAVIIALAIVGPLASSFDPRDIGGQQLAEPSLKHLMGTDRLGRDVLSGGIH